MTIAVLGEKKEVKDNQILPELVEQKNGDFSGGGC